jgi:hypothetical protein
LLNGFCPDCEREWSGLKEAHCATCCAHFTSDRAFDRHLNPLDAEEPCSDPATMKRRNGKPLFESIERKHGPTWKFKDDRVHPFAVSHAGALSDSTKNLQVA